MKKTETLKPPQSKPTCLMQVPPVYTGNWTDDSWERWIANSCPCEMHVAYRESLKAKVV